MYFLGSVISPDIAAAAAVKGLASIVLAWVPIIGGLLSWLVSVLGLILWIVLMVKAYQGIRYKLPWAGDFAEKQIG